MNRRGGRLRPERSAPFYGPQPLPTAAAVRFLVGSVWTGGPEHQELRAQVEAHILATGDCVLHAMAVVTGKPCCCALCRPDIRRFA